jgi:outer membrane protein OmpA-like peptidoglycan-associated protein
MALSATRAQAVVAAGTAAGITPDRLSPDKPVADNATDERRARNRWSW